MRVHPPALVDQHRQHEDETEQDREVHDAPDDRDAAQHPGEDDDAEQEREGGEVRGKVGEIGHGGRPGEQGKARGPCNGEAVHSLTDCKVPVVTRALSRGPLCRTPCG